jgi:hypothetical protein
MSIITDLDEVGVPQAVADDDGIGRRGHGARNELTRDRRSVNLANARKAGNDGQRNNSRMVSRVEQSLQVGIATQVRLGEVKLNLLSELRHERVFRRRRWLVVLILSRCRRHQIVTIHGRGIHGVMIQKVFRHKNIKERSEGERGAAHVRCR